MSGLSFGQLAGLKAGEGLLNAGVQFGGMVLENEYQKQAEQRANDEWTRRFDMENEYNTPSAQAERLRKAGFNPYASLTGSAPTPSATGSTNTPQGAKSNVSGLDLNLAELSLQQKRLDNETNVADAQAQVLRAEASKILADESNTYWQMELSRRSDERAERLLSLQEKLGNEDWRVKKAQADIIEATKDTQIAMSEQELENMRWDMKYTISQISRTETLNKETEMICLDYLSIWAQRDLQNELLKNNIKLTAQEADLFYVKLANMEADTLVKLSKGKLNEEQANVAIADAKRIEALTKEIPADAKVRRNTMRWDTYFNGSVDAIGNCAGNIARVIGAIGTGGVSEVLKSNIVTDPASTPE